MKAVIIVDNGVEDLEFFYPYFRFLEAGFDVDVVALEAGNYTGKHGYAINAAAMPVETKMKDYDLLILPGGKAPESVRNHQPVKEMVKTFMEDDKIVAAICHGAQILISANVLQNRKATCYEGIKDDIIAAGATYSNDPVVVDGNLITSRIPDDLPSFCREIFMAIEKRS